MKWLNALGMLFEFLSFWLAAPEILGNNGLNRLKHVLTMLITNLSVIVISLIVLGYGLGFTLTGIIQGLNASEFGATKAELIRYYLILFAGTALYFIFILRYRKIKAWIDTKIAVPLIENLINNDTLRKKSLVAGATLFTFGFLIQFIIILVQP